MKALLVMLNMSKVGGVQEDAFMAVGTLVECIGQGFMNYFPVFKPFLIQGLQNRAEYQVRYDPFFLFCQFCLDLPCIFSPAI